MNKTEGIHNVVKRLHTAGTYDMTSDPYQTATANITFLNKNCKFLSFVEKEKLVSLLRNQDPHSELLISSLREENPSKDHAKLVLYAFLYPKQANKKSLEALNQQMQGKYQTQSALSSIHKEPKENPSRSPIHLDYGQIDSFQSYKDSKIIEKSSKNIIPQKVEISRYDKRVRGGNIKASTNKDIFGKLQRLVQGTNKGYFDASQEDRRAEIGRKRELEDKNRIGNYSHMVSRKENSKRYGFREQSYNTRNDDSFPQSYSNINHNHVLLENTHHLNFNDSNGHYDAQDFEGTSPEFLQSLGFKSFTEITSPNKSVSYSEMLPKREQGKNTYQRSKGQAGDFAHERNKQSYNPEIGVYDEQNTQERNIRREDERIYLRDKENLRIDGVSDKANEVINGLLGDLGKSGIYHSLLKKLEKTQQSIERSPPHFKSFEEGENKEQNITLVSESPFESKKKIQTRNLKTEASDIQKDKNDILLNEFSVGGRTEKYVSVNMIKRFLESNEIYAEDIVEEVFRHLDDNVVNKNYFMQVMSNYLNCVPQQHAQLQVQDIVYKMFEICDKNGDGIISPNDLGSGVTLFSQLRVNIGQEQKLYKLLDPQNKGFLTENDIISLFVKVNNETSLTGGKLFTGTDEINERAKKIMQELDKEKKGVITYWNVLLWKDSNSFWEITNKLNQFLDGSDKQFTLNSLHANKGVALELGREQPNFAETFNKKSVPSEIIEPNSYFQEETKIQTSTVPVPFLTIQSTSSPYLQSPPRELLQNLSPFETLTRGTKTVDFTLSPQTENYTPFKDPINFENHLYSSTKKPEGNINTLRTNLHQEDKSAPKIYIRENQYATGDIYESAKSTENFNKNAETFGVSSTNPEKGNVISDIDQILQSPVFDIMSRIDLPFSGVRKIPESSKLAEIKNYLKELDQGTSK